MAKKQLANNSIPEIDPIITLIEKNHEELQLVKEKSITEDKVNLIMETKLSEQYKILDSRLDQIAENIAKINLLLSLSGKWVLRGVIAIGLLVISSLGYVLTHLSEVINILKILNKS